MGICPRFEPDTPAGRIRAVRDVTRSENKWIRSLARLVDDDSVADFQPGSLRDFHVRLNSDPGNDRVDHELLPIRQARLRFVVSLLQRDNRRLQPDIDTVFFV